MVALRKTLSGTEGRDTSDDCNDGLVSEADSKKFDSGAGGRDKCDGDENVLF